jgi:hypothetical protein
MSDAEGALASVLRGEIAWALIDPALCPEALGHRTTRQAHTLVVQGVSASDHDAKAVLPFLVPLSDKPADRQRQLKTFETWALECHAASWFSSNQSVDELAVLLGQRLDVVLSDNQAALLRISDARILPVVHSVLSDVERAAFFSPVLRWWYFDRQEKLQCIMGGDEPTASEWKTPWRVQLPQESALLLAAEADAVLALLREQAPDQLNALPRAKRHGFVVDLMQEAQQWGIDSAAHHALYCLISMSTGRDFSERPSWRRALAKVRDKTITLIQAIELVEQGTT